MKLSIFTTITNPVHRQDPYLEALSCYKDLADEIVVMDGSENAIPVEDDKLRVIPYRWPEEFEWSFISQQFQRGYEACTGDWVIRADLDYFFHEKDMSTLRFILDTMPDKTPALSFLKYQFLLVDQYQIKSRLVAAVNKATYGDRIKFNGGGDLCQPTLDGKLLTSDNVPNIRMPIYNYDFSFKSQKVIYWEFGRFARAWAKTFGNRRLWGPDNESAFEYFQKMVVGRFSDRGHKHIALDEHPKYIQSTIRDLAADRFGHSGFGWFKEKASYYQNTNNPS